MKTKTKNLYKTLLALESMDEANQFLGDLLTENEISEFSDRLEVARLLSAHVTYAEIERRTGVSQPTIARISKWLKKGNGGYGLMLKRMAADLDSHHHDSDIEESS